MIGTLDEDTYFARRIALEAAIATAQAEYDRDTLAAELANDLAFDWIVARANLQGLEDRKTSLDRAWVVVQERELASKAADAEAERLADIAQLKSIGAEAMAAAEDMEAQFDLFMEKLSAYMDLTTRFGAHLASATSQSPHQRRTLDIIGHNMVGPCIVGKLRRANLPSLDDFDAVDAMRAFEGKSPSGLAKDRIKKALASAAQDIPELKPTTAEGKAE